jgi:hypothetical protein
MPRGDLRRDLDVALNESSWLGIRVYADRREVALGFEVLTLPEGDGGDGSETLTLRLQGVSRIVASLRSGRWDDADARVETLTLGELRAVVASFHGQPVYGWEFFDLGDDAWAGWRDRVSLDVRFVQRESPHSLQLFQEAGPTEFGTRHLDFRVWFDRIWAYDQDGVDLDLAEIARGGRRWWDALRRGDERTRGSGIVVGREWRGH